MITKRELESIPSINRRIKRYKELLDNLSYDVPDGAKGLDYTRDRVQTSNQDIQENIIVNWITRMDSHKKRIRGYKKELEHKLNSAYEFIDSIEDNLDKEIIERHCIFGETFLDIAVDIGKSQSGIHKRYSKCLLDHKIF